MDTGTMMAVSIIKAPSPGWEWAYSPWPLSRAQNQLEAVQNLACREDTLHHKIHVGPLTHNLGLHCHLVCIGNVPTLPHFCPEAITQKEERKNTTPDDFPLGEPTCHNGLNLQGGKTSRQQCQQVPAIC